MTTDPMSGTEDQSNEPDYTGPRETARFRRQNTIEGIKMAGTLESYPDNVTDEEHYNTLKANSAELAQLNAKEATIQARYERMIGVSRFIGSQQPQENVIAFYDRTQEKTVAPSQQTLPEQVGDNQGNPQPNQAANQNVPERVAARYLRLKNQYYFQDKTLAFEDGGKKIKLETENVTVIRDAVAIAEARSWQVITVSGTDNFKQQVWREATMKGIEVVGYKPTELEQAELLKAMAARDSKSAEPQQKPKQRDDVTTGVLLAHGSDHYQHDPEKGKSYFVKLEVNGQEVTKWGADFKRAFADSQSRPQVGDTVMLSNVGKQSVNIPAQTRDEDGNTVETQKPVQKNTWRIEKEDFQTALEEHAEALRTGKEIEQKIIAQMPQVAAAITAAKLGEKIAEQAHRSGVIKSEDEKATLIYLIREGLASALEKGKKITAPEVKEQGQQATIDANSVLNDRKPPFMTKEPGKQEPGISR